VLTHFSIVKSCARYRTDERPTFRIAQVAARSGCLAWRRCVVSTLETSNSS
jgi:hypothetical protein